MSSTSEWWKALTPAGVKDKEARGTNVCHCSLKETPHRHVCVHTHRVTSGDDGEKKLMEMWKDRERCESGCLSPRGLELVITVVKDTHSIPSAGRQQQTCWNKKLDRVWCLTPSDSESRNQNKPIYKCAFFLMYKLWYCHCKTVFYYLMGKCMFPYVMSCYCIHQLTWHRM